MAKIIYRKGMEGLNSLSYIDGIEIELRKGQKALIYPKYAERKMLTSEQIGKWNASNETEIEALKVTDTKQQTMALFNMGSPAAEHVSQFLSEKYGFFCLPSLLAAMEIQHQRAEIDALASTIEGAGLLRDFDSFVWSCSRYIANRGWYANGSNGFASYSYLSGSLWVVPLVLYR